MPSVQNPSKASQNPRIQCPACAKDKKHSDNEIEFYHPQWHEFRQATKGLSFTSDFNTALEAQMRDSLATIGERVLAWLKRKSWGNRSLYCVSEFDGDPLYQVDCAAELKIDKRSVSKACAYLEKRGYLERRGRSKMLYPCISPALDGPDSGDGTKSEGNLKKSPEWATFLEEWKVACSTDFHELEVARSTVERIRKVVRSEYKKWLALRTKRPAIRDKEGNKVIKLASQPPRPPPDPRREEIRTIIETELPAPGKVQTASDSLCEKVDSKLQGAPLENFRHYLRENRKRAKGLGIAAQFAEDVGNDWSATAKLRAEERKRKDQRELEAIADLAESDPDPEVREQMRRRLSELRRE